MKESLRGGETFQGDGEHIVRKSRSGAVGKTVDTKKWGVPNTEVLARAVR